MFATIRRHYVWAIAGFSITVLFVAYQHLINFRIPPSSSTLVLIGSFTILCPPALLSIPIIDAEVGTSGFYFLWTIIALLNAGLYVLVGAMIGRLRKRPAKSA